jgi:hypothetical protein
VIDYTQPGAATRPMPEQRVIPRQHLQRFRYPSANEMPGWRSREDEPGDPYRHDAVFQNNWSQTWDGMRSSGRERDHLGRSVPRTSWRDR